MTTSTALDTRGGVTAPSSAGRLALAAAVTLVLSGIALALFFSNVAYVFGPINDVLLGLTFVLVVPAILSVRRLAVDVTGPWITWLSYAAVAGIVLLVVGQVLLVTRSMSLGMSFITLSVGALPFMAWTVAIGILALRGRILTPGVGFWGIGMAVALVLAAATWGVLPMGLWAAFGVVLLLAFTGFLVVLGRAMVALERGH
jgi:hypothetical protein